MRIPGLCYPDELSKEDLAELVEVVQEVLWLDMDADSCWQMNPDKEWDVDMLDRIGQAMEKAGLRPERCVSAPETENES
jgi:hypothetical protein